MHARTHTCTHAHTHTPYTCGQVVIPQWLFAHRDDFGKPIWSDKYSHTSYQHLAHLSLLSYIHSKIAREQADLLQPLVAMCENNIARKLPLPVKLTARKDDIEFGYTFLSLRHAHGSRGGGGGVGAVSAGGKISPRVSPKVWRKRAVSRLRSLTELPAGSSAPPEKVSEYSLTAELLAYVSHQSSLLAGIIHLLSPPPPSSSSSSFSTFTGGRKIGKSGKVSFEEDSTTGVGFSGDAFEAEKEQEKEREREKEKEKDEKEKKDEGGGGRKTLFGLKGRGKPPLTRRTSYDDKAPLMAVPSSWQRELDDVLVQFVTLPPMQQFLQARLSYFRNVLSWDPAPSKPSSGGRQRTSSWFLDAGTSLRRLAVLPCRGEELGRTCSYAMHRLVEAGQTQEAVRFLASEPAACHRERLHLMKDLAVCSVFVETYSEILALGHSGEHARETMAPTAPSPLSLLSQLSDPEMAARLALSSLHNWPVEMCVDILTYCSHHLPPPSLLLPNIQGKLERMLVYASIMEECKSLLRSGRGQGRGGRTLQSSWHSWSELASDSEKRSEYVRDVLLNCRAFDLARNWAQVHYLDQNITQVCLSMSVCL